MTALRRERVRLYLRITAASALIGVLYAIATNPWPTPGHELGTAAMNGTVISALVGLFEVFVFPSSRLRAFAALPFAVVVALKTALYGLIVIGTLTRGGSESPSTLAFVFSLMVTFVVVVAMQVAQLLGFRTARDLFLGRYRQPHRERRFFLFVDVAGSTGIAERLGPMEAHRFLAAVFAAAAEPVAACRGEIVQYVGDEVVVTWTEAAGAVEARPIQCFFAIEAALARQEKDFEEKFQTRPRLRAALHFGEVIAGEVGVWRRAIVFHGDVMNTASRLENATREVGARFIASREALQALEGSTLEGVATCRDLGELALRGRKEAIRACGIERA
jgi:adenylate cyclase